MQNLIKKFNTKENETRTLSLKRRKGVCAIFLFLTLKKWQTFMKDTTKLQIKSHYLMITFQMLDITCD